MVSTGVDSAVIDAAPRREFLIRSSGAFSSTPAPREGRVDGVGLDRHRYARRPPRPRRRARKKLRRLHAIEQRERATHFSGYINTGGPADCSSPVASAREAVEDLLFPRLDAIADRGYETICERRRRAVDAARGRVRLAHVQLHGLRKAVVAHLCGALYSTRHARTTRRWRGKLT